MPREEITPPNQSPALMRVEWFKYCERGIDYRTEAHIQRHYQWYHVVRGEVSGRVDGKEFNLTSGQSILFKPQSTRQHRAERRSLAYFVTLFESSPLLDLSVLNNRTVQMPAVLESDMQTLIEEARRPSQDCGILTQALVARLMVGLKRYVTAETAPAPASSLTRGYNNALVDRIELFMRHNYHENISRDEIASHLSMSPGHVARIYRSVTGLTLVDRITQLRIQAAKNLLLDSTLTVSQIAMEVGYASFSHFSKTFKDLEKLSPGDYRRARGVSLQTDLPNPV
jgi:AraC-like DNA-binding protein